jgi:hypothetical protein
LPAVPVASRRESNALRSATVLLAGGVVAFVASASVAVGLELLPDRASQVQHRDVVNTAETPALRPETAPAAPAPQELSAPDGAQAPTAPQPEAKPTFDYVPVVAMTMNVPPPEAPPADAPLDPADAPPAAAAPQLPAVIDPPAPPAVQPKQSLRERIWDRLHGG